MQGCIRYWSVKSVYSMPMDKRRSNMEISKPLVCASWLSTVAGNWHWSPTMTACTAPLPKGKMTAGSMTWAASSITMKGKVLLSKGPMPQPMQVAQTTSTVSKTAFMPFSPLLMPISPSRVSREYGSLAEHRPMRSTRTPNACSCWATLSQPLLLKADASTGPRLVFSHSQMIAEAVVVFPVPGGPWIKVKRCLLSRTISHAFC
mmetsp:Transcript_30907/g.73696  ORF Transcript_30907/g.73696 Transcript_30907/m.73696 type:complete len:204 (-) Transcript_30907:1124-1735(-)